MQIKLKSLHLENFKGAKDKIYQFGDITRISGMNRLGKTTIATAWFWLLADKNYELNSNPNIRPDDVEECIPTVTAVLDIDGKEVTIAKMQKRKVGKPDAKGVSKVTLTNTYAINEVPKTERDFKAYLEELGLSFDNFLVCSHPNVFTGQKTADMRKVLFKMASEKTDYDIASMSDETADVAKLLADYKFEEIEAMQKASKKKAVEQVEAIPNQIVGLEKAKVDIDVAEQELAKADLERRIAEIDEKIEDSGKAVDGLCGESMQLQFDINGLYTEANDKLIHERRELENARDEAQIAFNDAHNTVSNAQKQIDINTRQIELEEQKKPEINKRWTENLSQTFDETPYLFDESKWIFDENSTVCSLCGQKLPEDKIASLKEEFEQKKATAKAGAEKKLADAREKFNSDRQAVKDSLNLEANAIKQTIQELTGKNTSLQKEIEAARKAETDATAKKNQLEKQLSELPEKPDMSQNEEYQQKKARYDELEKQIASLKDSTSAADAFKEERKALVAELDSVKEIIAQSANNVRIDEQIFELQEKQRDYEQAKTDAEKILDQLKLVSQKKNELLVEEINNHFGIVKWKLFDYMKNSNYTECCVPIIDGKEFGKSTNTGREIQAKLDICNSMQKFFGMHIPVFLDGAESINDEYLPKVDTQLILLTVTKDKELKVEVE